MFFLDDEAIEHLLHIRSYRNRLSAKAHYDPEEGVVHVGAKEKHIIE